MQVRTPLVPREARDDNERQQLRRGGYLGQVCSYQPGVVVRIMTQHVCDDVRRSRAGVPAKDTDGISDRTRIRGRLRCGIS